MERDKELFYIANLKLQIKSLFEESQDQFKSESDEYFSEELLFCAMWGVIEELYVEGIQGPKRHKGHDLEGDFRSDLGESIKCHDLFKMLIKNAFDYDEYMTKAEVVDQALIEFKFELLNELTIKKLENDK